MKRSQQINAVWRRGLYGGFASSLLAVGLMASPGAGAHAKPLDADACARLKSQRDALEASGVRSAIAEKPPTRPTRSLDERAKQIVALIQIDGQLRFRCNLELPIASLKPELMVEVADVIDGEPAPKVVPAKRPAPKRKKVVPAAVEAATPPAPAGTPTAERQKTAGATKAATAAVATEPAAAKARPKTRAKVDDAYQAPAKAETPVQPQ